LEWQDQKHGNRTNVGGELDAEVAVHAQVELDAVELPA
jgi:hypothetical protein